MHEISASHENCGGCLKFRRKTQAEVCCGKLLRKIGAELLRKNAAENFCGKLLRKIAAENFCGKLLRKTSADIQNSCAWQYTIELRRTLKSPRLVKFLRQKNYCASKISAPVKIHAEKSGAFLLFGLGRISNCWLPPSLAEELSFRSS